MAGMTSSNQGAHEVYGGIALATPSGSSAMDEGTGSVRVNVVAGAGSGGTAATDDTAFAVGAGSGTPVMGLADETAPDLVDEGDVGVVRMTLARGLHVNLRDSTGAEVALGGGGGGGASATDDAAFIIGVGLGTPIMGLADETAPDAVDEGDVGAVRMTLNRALHVNLRDASGAELALGGGGGGTEYAEDTPSTAGQIVTMAGVVRQDTAASLVDTDGDRTQLQVDANGRLWVNASGAPVPVTNPALAVVGGGAEATAQRVTIASDSTGVLSVDDNGGSLTVDGAVAATQSGVWTVQPGNTANTTPWLATIAQGGNSATVSAGGALLVDSSATTQPVSGTVTANQGAAPWSSNTTQLAGVAIATGSGNSSTGTQRVVIATDQPQLTNALKVDGSAVVQPVSMRTPLTPSAPAQGTIAVTSGTLLAANANRKGLIITNTGTGRFSLNLVGGTASLDAGVTLYPGDSFSMDGWSFSTSQINAIASVASSAFALQEFS